jgi:AbrB family looped-hinge helix DNA binding protein
MALKARISTRGRVTIPKKVRDALGWQSGENFRFIRYGDRVLVERAENGTQNT